MGALPAIGQLPVLQDSRVQPFHDQPQDPLVRDPVPEEPFQPSPVEMVEKAADIRVQHPVHPLPEPDRQGVQRIMLAPSRTEPVGEALEVRLVDRVQHLADRTLDDLVLQRRDAERPQPPVRLRDVDAPRRHRPVLPRLHPRVQGQQVLLPVPVVSRQVTPSTPGAASFFKASNASDSRRQLTWCSSAVNRASLSFRATSRTRPSPFDTPGPALRPGRVSPPVFPMTQFLSSPASSARASFGRLAGTTN